MRSLINLLISTMCCDSCILCCIPTYKLQTLKSFRSSRVSKYSNVNTTTIKSLNRQFETRGHWKLYATWARVSLICILLSILLNYEHVLTVHLAWHQSLKYDLAVPMLCCSTDQYQTLAWQSICHQNYAFSQRRHHQLHKIQCCHQLGLFRFPSE